jgi:hypothetical protein
MIHAGENNRHPTFKPKEHELFNCPDKPEKRYRNQNKPSKSRKKKAIRKIKGRDSKNNKDIDQTQIKYLHDAAVGESERS